MAEKSTVQQAGATRRMPPRRQVNLRLSEEVYQVIRAMADAEGQTLNAAVTEVVRRRHEADQRFEDTFGSRDAFLIGRALLTAAELQVAAVKGDGSARRWLTDPESFDVAAAAIVRTLESLRPGPLQEALAEVEGVRAGSHFSARITRGGRG